MQMNSFVVDKPAQFSPVNKMASKSKMDNSLTFSFPFFIVLFFDYLPICNKVNMGVVYL